MNLAMEGEQLKLLGMSRVSRAESDQWNERAANVITYLAESGKPFTADDVRELAGDPSRVNALGAAMSRAAKAGIIDRVGTQNASRPSRHASLQVIWVGTGMAASASSVGDLTT